MPSQLAGWTTFWMESSAGKFTSSLTSVAGPAPLLVTVIVTVVPPGSQ